MHDAQTHLRQAHHRQLRHGSSLNYCSCYRCRCYCRCSVAAGKLHVWEQTSVRESMSRSMQLNDQHAGHSATQCHAGLMPALLSPVAVPAGCSCRSCRCVAVAAPYRFCHGRLPGGAAYGHAALHAQVNSLSITSTDLSYCTSGCHARRAHLLLTSLVLLPLCLCSCDSCDCMEVVRLRAGTNATATTSRQGKLAAQAPPLQPRSRGAERPP